MRASICALFATTAAIAAQAGESPVLPSALQPGSMLQRIASDVSATELHATVARLVGFGTRHTLSETKSDKRGIGAARRWVKSRFDAISRDCGGCLEIVTPAQTVTGKRIPAPTDVMDVVAIQRGTSDPQRVVVVTGHLDSRVTDVMDATHDAPGANDDGSGSAAVIEAARVLSKHKFAATIVYGVLSGEEQGLYGGKVLADYARDRHWQIEADLNNDIVGNTHGQDGVVDNTTVRVFSEGIKRARPELNSAAKSGGFLTSAGEDDGLKDIRYHGGEVDSPSRNIARYLAALAERDLVNFHVRLVYRTDRYGRGGDQVPFLEAGYPAVRLTEPHENYTRQHQDVRRENGIAYGDVIDGVDFDYLANVTRLNALALASLAAAPAPPNGVDIAGAVSSDTTLQWQPAPGAASYRVWWRDTLAPEWQHHRDVGDVAKATLERITVDDWFFGVSAVSADGYESPVVFPGDTGSFVSAAPAPPQKP